MNLLMEVTQSYKSKDGKNRFWESVARSNRCDVKLIHINGPNFYL